MIAFVDVRQEVPLIKSLTMIIFNNANFVKSDFNSKKRW